MCFSILVLLVLERLFNKQPSISNGHSNRAPSKKDFVSTVVPFLANSSAVQLPSMFSCPGTQISDILQCFAISLRDLRHSIIVSELTLHEFNVFKAAWLSENNSRIRFYNLS